MIEQLPAPARAAQRRAAAASSHTWTIHAYGHPADLGGSPLCSPPGGRALLQPLAPALPEAARLAALDAGTEPLRQARAAMRAGGAERRRLPGGPRRPGLDHLARPRDLRGPGRRRGLPDRPALGVSGPAAAAPLPAGDPARRGPGAR